MNQETSKQEKHDSSLRFAAQSLIKLVDDHKIDDESRVFYLVVDLLEFIDSLGDVFEFISSFDNYELWVNKGLGMIDESIALLEDIFSNTEYFGVKGRIAHMQITRKRNKRINAIPSNIDNYLNQLFEYIKLHTIDPKSYVVFNNYKPINLALKYKKNNFDANLYNKQYAKYLDKYKFIESKKQ